MGLVLEEMGQLLYVMHRVFGFGFLQPSATVLSEDSYQALSACCPSLKLDGANLSGSPWAVVSKV